ncbi:MAG: GNAT family N-acetyltransferase [Candidatus Eisenbacteria bacterium]
MDLIVRKLPHEAISRVGEIDRSEHITRGYVFKKGVLESQQVDWKVPRWSADPSKGFSIRARMEEWNPLLEDGGVLLGALEGETLAGIAIMRPELSKGVAQLAALYVDRLYRRRGVASMLVAEAERLAREAGAEKLYVSAIASESAVGFYLERGFKPTEDANEELFTLEPDDIHMIKLL